MSRNFELLRRLQKNPETLEQLPVPADATAIPVRYEPPPRRVRPEAIPEQSDWLRAVNVLKKRWRLSAIFTVAVVAVVTLVTLLMKPVYEPVARVQVDPPGTEIVQLGAASGPSYDELGFAETQIQTLQSDALALAVIRNLHLDQNPDIVGKLKDDGATPDEQGLVLTPAEHRALRTFQDRLKIRREADSRLIQVAFGAHDPVLASQITNSVISAFIELNFKTRHDAVMESTQWTSKQLDDLRAKMEDSQKALADFQRNSGIIDDNRSIFSDQMTEQSKELTTIQAERMQLESYLKKAQPGDESDLPQVQASPVVQELEKKLAETRSELSNTLAVYGKNHPNSKKLQNQVDELQAQLNLQRKAIVSDLDVSFAAAEARENMMHNQIRVTTQELNQISKFNALKKQADADTQLYTSLYAKIREAGIAASSKSSNIRVVDHARVLDRPTRPNRLLNISLGLFAGLLGGVVLAFLREGLDTTIHTPEDIKKCLGASSVSIVPVIGAGAGYRYGLEALGQRSQRLLSGRKPAFESAQKFLLDRPNSPEAEALRGLYTSVRLSSPGRPPQVLLVVSPFPGEGKTTLALNLAIALAQQGRTCLIDADLRKSGVAQAFGLQNEVGLATVLSGQTALEQALRPVAEVRNLSVLPTGPAPADPGQLIGAESTATMIRSLRQDFEFVVIDSPPIIPFADGRALSHLVDGVVLVGRSGSTTREAMVRSMELLEEVHSAPVLDIVLNAADVNTAPEYGYGYADYYKRSRA